MNKRGKGLISIMNRKQEILIWATLIIIQIMIIFPPVRRLEQAPEGVEEPPEISVVTGWVPDYGIIVRDYKHIWYVALAVQTGIVAAISLILVPFLREKEPEEEDQ
jgi:hypothetical protein